MSTLHERCLKFYQQQGRNAILRQGYPVEDLKAFVVSEIGRTADERLDASLPLCLYFATEDDRQDFINTVTLAKPDMISKKVP